MKTFLKWTIAEVEETFNLVMQKHRKRLEEWQTVTLKPAREEEKLLNGLREKLQDHVWDWNEWELKAKFILPLLLAVDFDEDNYQSFLERDISVEFDGEKLSGTVDFLVAGGRRYPKHPYFFLNEFKREHESSGDPLGQLLVAMVAAQKVNNDGNPVYGCYVMGRFWFFVVLEGLDYASSLAYDAAKNDIMDIFGILKNLKEIINLMISNSSLSSAC